MSFSHRLLAEAERAPEEAAQALPADAAGLSARELEVLRLVAEGLSDAQVAQRLYLSPRTVGWDLRSVYRKLDVSSRTAAAKRAAERGLQTKHLQGMLAKCQRLAS